MTPIQNAVTLLGGPSKAAQALNVTPQAVCFWRDQKRAIPAEKCTAIEQLLAGQITRRDLRQRDWWLIWPELISADFPVPHDRQVA